MKVGIGFDVHPLKEGRRLILGGCEIPHPKGLLGHSDGDCLIHALVDAILGALGKGDIGSFFPDTDPQYKDISSLYFLRETKRILAEEGFRIVNIDTVVVSEEVMIEPYREAMRRKIAEVLACAPEMVSIKGKRGEGVIDKEAIISWAVVLLERI
jgi:2-C-methyl-D-erythritol 2,4-cyclodiphosphate synthase